MNITSLLNPSLPSSSSHHPRLYPAPSSSSQTAQTPLNPTFSSSLNVDASEGADRPEDAFARDLQVFRVSMWREAGDDPAHQFESDRLVRRALAPPRCESFPDHHLILRDLDDYARVCFDLGLPPFPVTDTKAALFAGRSLDLPWSQYLRDHSKVPCLHPSYIEQVFFGLRLAGQATSSFWEPVRSFTAFPEEYDNTASILTVVRSPPYVSSQFAPGPPPGTYSGAAPSSPPSPELFHLASLADVLADLENALSSLQHRTVDYPDPELQHRADYRIRRRIRELGSKPTSARAPKLLACYQEWLAFTSSVGITAHPIDSLKMVMFALAVTPGPARDVVHRSAPLIESQRISPKRLEDKLETLAELQQFAGIDVGDEDRAQWQIWKEDLKIDFNTKTHRRLSSPSISSQSPPATVDTSSRDEAPTPVSRSSGRKRKSESCGPSESSSTPPPATKREKRERLAPLDVNIPPKRKLEPPPPPPPSRPPPLPLVIAFPEALSDEESRTIALHRPRRGSPALVEMVEWEQD